MIDSNKSLVRRLVEEVWSGGRFGPIDELVAPDFVGHSADPPEVAAPTCGTDGYRDYFAGLRGAFPDLQITIEDQVAEGDRVVTRWTARGTHRGAFAGIPPTGKRGVVTGTTTYRIGDGKVQEGWTNLDDLGLLRQLGAMPPAARAS